MRPKIVPFKFRKKHTETKGKITKSKKNYENIFNDILSGTKPEKHLKPYTKRETRDQNNSNINKKNKIKFISKLQTINLNDESNQISKNKFLTEENEKNNTQELNNTTKKNKININSDPKINITDNKDNEKDKNIIDELLNKSIERKNNKKGKDGVIEQFRVENNKSTANEIIIFLNENNKSSNLYSNSKKHNYIKCVKTMKNNNKSNKNSKKCNKSLPKKDYQFERSPSKTNNVKNKIKQKKFDKIKENGPKSKNNTLKKFEQKRDISIRKADDLIYNNKKIRVYNNTVDKITITNDSSKDNNFKDSISINNTIKNKRLILNNTNSNINININITNINDKNNKKEKSVSSKRKQSGLNTENNYNNNITTVNIINNNGNNKKISSNDYRLLFFNHSNKKYLPHQTKLNSKGIKIESIDINLNEEDLHINNKKQKYKFKRNLKKNNYYQNYKNVLDTNEIKETQSEYEHFNDKEDFWSNKSSTGYSCKSGFTVARKFRSLNRERDKIKMLNNLKNPGNNKIDKIEDKLINIVNKFHKENSINKMNRKRKGINKW